jgi:hypothetical protein
MSKGSVVKTDQEESSQLKEDWCGTSDQLKHQQEKVGSEFATVRDPRIIKAAFLAKL